MRLPTTLKRFSAFFAHLRMRLESPTTGTMKSGNPTQMTTSVGSIRFATANQTM